MAPRHIKKNIKSKRCNASTSSGIKIRDSIEYILNLHKEERESIISNGMSMINRYLFDVYSFAAPSSFEEKPIDDIIYTMYDNGNKREFYETFSRYIHTFCHEISLEEIFTGDIVMVTHVDNHDNRIDFAVISGINTMMIHYDKIGVIVNSIAGYNIQKAFRGTK